MAPPQLKCGSRDLQKYRCSSQVFKRDRISKSAECAETKAKPSQGKSSKSACTCSSASDDQSGYKTRPLESTRCLAKLFTSHPALFLDGPSDSRSNHLAEENTEVKLPDQHVSPSPPDSGSTRRLNMNDMPTEILQLIWGGVINTPACHTFKVKRGEVSEEGSRWSVHLWPATSRAELDTSAYQLWKHCLELNNIGFQMAFRRFVKEVQPIALRVPIASNSKYKAAKFYKTMAAIDKGQDLVILELDRGDSLPWFEHTLRKRGMDSRVIRDRMSDFRRVAIHYKYSHIDCRDGGAFACLCHGNNQPHEVYKACPLALASFLDLFPNLEQFYFVVDQKLVRHKKFAAAYRGKSVWQISAGQKLMLLCRQSRQDWFSSPD